MTLLSSLSALITAIGADIKSLNTSVAAQALAANTASALSTANAIYPNGKIVWESDTGNVKIGDGVTAWNYLPYVGDNRFVLASQLGSVAVTRWGNGAPAVLGTDRDGDTYVDRVSGAGYTFGSGVWTLSSNFVTQGSTAMSTLLRDSTTTLTSSASLIFLLGTSQHAAIPVSLIGRTQIRLVVRVPVIGTTGAKMRVGYEVGTPDTTQANYLPMSMVGGVATHLEVPLDWTGPIAGIGDSGWLPINPACATDCYVALMINNNQNTTAQISHAMLWAR